MQDADVAIELEGLMLAPELDHDSTKENISQLIVMGRYSLADVSGDLEFSTDLFGDEEPEQQLEIRASRKSQNLTQEIELSPVNKSVVLNTALLST